jgi:hypothetical protein
MKFDHIGIFSKSLDEGRKHMRNIFEIKKLSREFHDQSLKVSIQFLTDKSGITYEIVAPFGKNNPVDKVLNKNKNILNHVAYRTKNFSKEIKKLRGVGCAPLDVAKKALAFNYAKVIFFITPLNFIIEIVQEVKKVKKKNNLK